MRINVSRFQRVNDLLGAWGDLGIFALATGGTYLAQHLDRPRTAVLVYLMGPTLIGARSGLYRGLAAAVAACSIYNFFLSEPVLRFGASSPDEIVPLIVFNLSAVVTGMLAGRLKDRAEAANAAEARTALLLRISDRLQAAVRVEDIAGLARRQLAELGVLDLELHLHNHCEVARTRKKRPQSGRVQAIAPEQEFDTHTTRTEVLELSGSHGALGVAQLIFPRNVTVGKDAAAFKAIANLLGLAIERCLLLEQLSETQAAQRSEELKSAILSSVSHDLRTPLTAIEAAASSLRSYEQNLSPAQRREMLETVIEQCRKLNRYTAKLLDMGRIQSGISRKILEEIDAVEILGVALSKARQSFPACLIDKRIECPAAIVLANGPMLEQAIFNVIENAIVHGIRDAPVHVGATGRAGACIIEISDNGPGIAVEDLPHVFERFYRSERRGSGDGSGLGLHISKGFIEAFGGRIAVESPLAAGKGTSVRISIPLARGCEELTP